MSNKGQKSQKVASKVTVPMKFRLSPKSISLKNKHTNLLQTIKALTPFASQVQNKKKNERFELKFCQKISEQHLLIGNEYQLNLLDFTNANKNYSEVASLWSIEHKDKITDIFVFHKINKIFVVHHSYLRCYGYKDDFIDTAPIFQAQLKFKDKVDTLYCPRKLTLLVFAGTQMTVFEMYTQNDSFKFNKLVTKTYRKQRKDICFLALPQNQGQTLSMFFETRQFQAEQSLNESRRIQKDIIYWLRIQMNNFADMEISEITEYCEIPTQSSSWNRKMRVLHYKQNIFLFLKGCELFALRNSYIIDKIKLSYLKVDSFVLFGSKELIFCYQNGSLDLYVLSLNQSRKPEHFQIKCVDNNKFTKPNGSIFFKVLLLGGRLIVIYQQPRPINTNQLNYWLAITHNIDKKEKVEQIFDSKGFLRYEEGYFLQDQLELTEKIGLQPNEAFLQIWNRCSKATKKDYEWLIATEDYNMIQEQVQNKIKKTSLKFYQIALVLKSSLQMLKQKVRNKCSAEVVRQLSVCHFLQCKIQMFEKEKRQTLKEGEEIYINVQDYYYLLNLELEKELLDLIGELCTQKKRVKIKIRALFTQFSLIYRMLYHQILPKIIKSLKQNFLLLLELIPEILPIKYKQDQLQQNLLNKGPWIKVDLQTTRDYMLLCHYISFQTQPFFNQFLSSKFYKVYQWHSHGAIANSIADLEKIVSLNDSNRVFTLLYQVLYQQKQKIGEYNLKKIIRKIQQYQQLPERLRGKFYFYCNLYQNFKEYFMSEKRSFHTVFEFLSLSEDELFLLYFKKERARKGIFILKEIKPIYQQFAAGGGELFIKNMFEFFKSEDSSWSDLKIILNKFNNQKKDFHQKNYDIFEVIVKGLMEKIKIGTDKSTEIGLDEVLPYLQNIPFPLKVGSLVDNLYSITQIHQQEQLLRRLKINMSLREILDRGQEIIFKMIEDAVERNRDLKVETKDEMLMMAYKILAEVGQKQGKIYFEKHFNFVFKSFLIVVMQDERLLTMCQSLVCDPLIVKKFRVGNKLIENVVLYLYRKKLYQKPNYLQSKEYINKLIEFLEPSSPKARFIVLSQAFAKIFTFKRFKINYPFFQSYYPTVTEIQRLLCNLNSEEIAAINQKKLFEVFFMLKMLRQEQQNTEETQTQAFTNYQGIERKNRQQHEIYTLVLLKIIREGLIGRGIEITKNILNIKTENRVFNIIYPIFLIQILQGELVLRVQEPMLKLLSHYFYSHEDLLSIVVRLTSGHKFSNEEIDDFISKKQQEKSNVLIINPNNQVFSSSFKQFIRDIQVNENIDAVNNMFEIIWKQISLRREEFKTNKIYNIMFRILLHDPFVLAQYIYRKQTGINVKSLRALFTLLGFQPVFNMKEVFKVCKAIFEALMIKLKSSMLLSDVLQNYKEGSVLKEELFYTEEYLESQVKLASQDLLGSSIMIMKGKLTCLEKNPEIQKDEKKKYKQIQELRYKPQIYLKRKEEQSQVILQKLYPNMYREKNKIITLEILKKGQYPEYPFNDQDNSYTETKYDLDLNISNYANQPPQFDKIKERSEKEQNFSQNNKIVLKKQIEDKIKSHQFYQLNQQNFQQKIRCKKNIKQQQKKDKCSSIKVLQIEDDKQLQQCFQNACIQGGFLFMLKTKKKRKQKKEKYEIRRNVVMDIDVDQKSIIDRMPEFTEQNPIRNEIINYLQQRKDFSIEVIEKIKQEQAQQIFEAVIQNIYKLKEYKYGKRIELIYKIKSALTKTEIKCEIGYMVTKRAGESQLLNKIITEIQDILPKCIFLQNFDKETLIKIVKQEVVQKVIYEQDYIKIAKLIGEMFKDPEIAEDIKLMFLIKLCRRYQKSSYGTKRNIKDKILQLANKIERSKLEQCIKKHRETKNKDLLEMSHLLQTIINLCTFTDEK